MSETLTPEAVERMINEAGRDRVFAKARELGWTTGGAPLWVWANICSDIMRASPNPPSPPPSHPSALWQ